MLNEIGSFTLSPQFLDSELALFSKLYANRPIQDNSGGMRFNHSFATWALLRHFQPKLIIESGVWKGHSTWLIEQACPQAELYCLDLSFERLEYQSKKAHYIQADFSTIDWSTVNKHDSLCFFDDHQNAYERLKDMAWFGFKHAIFEDNYSPAQGDCYSIRKALMGTGNPSVKAHQPLTHPQRLLKWGLIDITARYIYRSNQKILVPPTSSHIAQLNQVLETYYEFPPVYLTPSDFEKRQRQAMTACKTPLLASTESLPVGIAQSPTEFAYNYLAYVSLKT
jgi:hypothetical protein